MKHLRDGLLLLCLAGITLGAQQACGWLIFLAGTGLRHLAGK